jgi:hypothetical protein
VLRTVGYFMIWCVLAAWAVRAWGDFARMTRAASAGLIVYALTASWAGIDWLESLQPEFHSSIYGLLVITFQLLAGFAFVLALALLIERRRPVGHGEILLSTILLWAYNHAMQYIIIWAGNIPDEVVWYVQRSEDGWGVVLWLLILLQFVLPFFALLSARVRESGTALLALAGVTLAMRLVESFWLVLPATDAAGWIWLLAIPAAILGVVGAWAMAFRFVWEQLAPGGRHAAVASPASAS